MHVLLRVAVACAVLRCGSQDEHVVHLIAPVWSAAWDPSLLLAQPAQHSTHVGGAPGGQALLDWTEVLLLRSGPPVTSTVTN